MKLATESALLALGNTIFFFFFFYYTEVGRIANKDAT